MRQLDLPPASPAAVPCPSLSNVQGGARPDDSNSDSVDAADIAGDAAGEQGAAGESAIDALIDANLTSLVQLAEVRVGAPPLLAALRRSARQAGSRRQQGGAWHWCGVA